MNSPAPVKSRRSVDPKYRLTWTVGGREYSALIEAHVRPYVDALGIDGAIRFLLEWGGASAYLAKRPHKDGKLGQSLEAEQFAALVAALGGGGTHVSFPNGNKFIARALCAQNYSVAEISRRVRRTEMTTRRLLVDPRCAVESEASS